MAGSDASLITCLKTDDPAVWTAMPHRVIRTCAWVVTIAAAATLFTPGKAWAVAAFARQTGLACEACHTVFPELTPLGRRFKMSGYTWTPREPLVADVIGTSPEKQETRLSLTDMPPIALLLQASYSTWQRSPPNSGVACPPGAGPSACSWTPSTTEGNSQEGLALVPQQASLLWAGKLGEKFGAWAQFTYFQQPVGPTTGGSFYIDNNDWRYSDHTQDRKWLWGVTLNNGPTVQDVWATGGASGLPSTAFGIPYFPIPANLAAPFMAAPAILTLGTNSAGLGAYVFYDDSLYLELSGYRSAKPGVLRLDNTPENIAWNGAGTIDGVAPYWRAAYEWNHKEHSFMVGTIGMYLHYAPPGVPSLSQAGYYTDAGLDSEYQYIGDVHIFTAEAMWLHESSSNNAAVVQPAGTVFANKSDNLDRVTLTGSYYYNRKYGGMISYGSLTGKADPLLYCAGVTQMYLPSCSGSPSSSWETLELDYLPILNLKLFVQYNWFNKLGSGANPFFHTDLPNAKASDNNTFVVALWFTF